MDTLTLPTPCILDDKPVTLPCFEMRKMLEDCKTQMYNLIQELKEKHRLQRRYVLTAMKSDRKFLYEQQRTVSRNSRRTSCEDEDLTAGIVVAPQMFKKVINEEEDLDQESSGHKFVRVSFHIPTETDEN